VVTVKLFDDITGKGREPKELAEPSFDYLNSSVRPRCARIRDLLEQWYNHLPPEVQPELRSRFRTKDDQQHLGAFFELYLHELLSRLGFGVEFHPQIEKKGTHPDFKVLQDGKPLLYLEATLAAPSDTETAAGVREDRVYDVLSKMNSSNFHIGVKVPGPPATSPHIGIRESIQDKASKYGKLDLPYVIAVNVIDELGVDDIDVSNALLGEEQGTAIFRENSLIEGRPGRKPNGAWHGPRGPQNRRVSAALIAVNLFPGNSAKVIPMLWHNPWARIPLTQDIWPLPQLVPDFGTINL